MAYYTTLLVLSFPPQRVCSPNLSKSPTLPIDPSPCQICDTSLAFYYFTRAHTRRNHLSALQPTLETLAGGPRDPPPRTRKRNERRRRSETGLDKPNPYSMNPVLAGWLAGWMDGWNSKPYGVKPLAWAWASVRGIKVSRYRDSTVLGTLTLQVRTFICFV
jgi:hypothetical protein